MTSMSVDRRRFLTLASGIGIALLISSAYTFSIFSNVMKVEFDFGQGDIALIATIGNAFGMFSLPAGILFDAVGPGVVLLIATLMSTTGFVLFSLAFNRVIQGSMPVFCLASVLMNWGGGWMDVGSLMTSILNFPCHRGNVVLLQKTFMGLGSTILTTLYLAFFDGNAKEFSVFLVPLTLVFGLLGAATIRLPKYYITWWESRQLSEEEQDRIRHSVSDLETVQPSQSRFRLGYALLACNLIFLTVFNVVNVYVDFSTPAKLACAVLATILFMGFFAMPMLPDDKDTDEGAFSGAAVNRHSTDPLGERQALLRQGMERSMLGNEGNCEVLPHLPQIETPFMQNIRRPILWCLVWTCFCNLGTGMLIVMNSAQIYRALNNNSFDVSTNALFTAMIGVASALARISVGIIDRILDRQRLQRGGSVIVVRKSTNEVGVVVEIPLMISSFYWIPSLCFVVGIAMLITLPVSLLMVPLVIMSFAYGAIWGLSALIIRQIFTLDSGKHYNFCFFGGVAASVVLNRICFGMLYDREGERQHLYPFCSGLSCIKVCMLILIGVNCSGLLSASAVHMLFRHHCLRKLRSVHS